MRPHDFDPKAHPRTRSFDGAEAFLESVMSKPPMAGARFAGQLAAVYGVDRQWLGNQPTPRNIELLVHKALMLVCPEAGCDADVVFVVDGGAKAAAVSEYAAGAPRTIECAVRSMRRPEARVMRVRLDAALIDSAECAVASLPAEIGPGRGQSLLLVDIGHMRTKVALFSGDECEIQEPLDLGVADCVRRVLQNGQEAGLVADEFAVVRALENASDHVISIGERRFDVRAPLAAARRTLEEELARGVQRVLRERYRRRGEGCQVAAIVGGGAAVLGRGLAARLQAPEIALRTVWVTPDPSFQLAEGARRRRPS
jgi:hypothetical protein